MGIKDTFLSQFEIKNWIVFLMFTFVALILRYTTFSILTIDHDEHTYAVIADQLLNGSVLYKDVIDLKQPGIFIIFCGIQLLFGKSIFAIRFIAMLAISSSAFFLYLFKRQRGSNLISSLFTGFFFILMFNFPFGYTANAEVFFIWFVSLGILLFARSKHSIHYFFAGLVFGIGFIVKQHVAFDFAAVGLFFFITSIIDKQFKPNFVPMALMVLGFALPFILTNVFFYVIGFYEGYYFITYIAPGNYKSIWNWQTSLEFLWIDGITMYASFFILATLGLTSKFFKSKKNSLFLFFLLTADAIAVMITGKHFTHYVLQLCIPVSLAAGEIGNLKWIKKFFPYRFTNFVSVGLLVLLLLFVGKNFRTSYRPKNQVASKIYKLLQPQIKAGQTLYTGDGPHILYWLLDKESPTPYVHASLMTKNIHIRTLAIDVKNELNKILAKNPQFVILSSNYPYKWVKNRISDDYRVLKKIGKYRVYARRNKRTKKRKNDQ